MVLLLSLLFLSVYCGTVRMEQWPTLTASNLIQHQDKLLYLDNCRTSHSFLPPPTSSGSELASYHEALKSMLASPPHAACASCYLCHLHLEKLETHVSAYIYATRALLMFPKLAPALSCISALYLQQENFLRASFYAELAYRHAQNRSYFIHFKDVSNSDHLHMHLQSTGDALLRKEQLISCADTVAGLAEYAVLSDIFAALGRDNSTFLSAYLGHLHLLPRSLVGPSLAAYEAFLDHLEGAEMACSQARHGYYSSEHARALHVFPEYLPDIQWPTDKTIVIYSYVQIDSVLSTFGENNMGLSDALEKLGVPHRIVSRSIPEDDFITVLNIGKVADEEYGKYVFWSFEKNPSIQHNMNATGIDEKFDSCGNDVMRYSSEYINEASGIWESVLLNMVKWPYSVRNNFVPALLPDQSILQSKLANQFASKLFTTADDNTLVSLDAMRPIDILFFGSSNPHRNTVHEKFRELAKEHDLHIVFYMDYAFFGAERELAIQQSKIVLNLANFRWPFTTDDRPQRSSIPSMNFGAAETCGAATNFHRVRSLLAYGKVVLSERSGSTLEESLLSDFVSFADTDDLVSVSLSLLLNPVQRYQLETKAISYMLQDHTQEHVQTSEGRQASSIALLARAVTELAAHSWPSTTADRMNLSPLSKAEYLVHLSTRQLNNLDRIKTNFTQAQELSSARADAALGWAEITCLCFSQELDVSSAPKLHLEGGLVGVTSNASNACHKQSSLPILLGYLSRRYQYRGKVLMVGFTLTEALQTLRHMNQFEDTQLHVIPSGSLAAHEALDIITTRLLSFSGQTFDVVVINQELLRFGFKDLQQVLLSCLQYLRARTGMLIINHMFVSRYFVEKTLSDTGDAWKLLVAVRQYDFFDAALANFDNGLLIFCLRSNPFLQSAQFFLDRTESLLRLFLDRIIPILSLSEVHTWLSNSSGTTRYVRTFRRV